MAAALNACGYDAGLSDSLPVRLEIRQEMAAAIAASPAARKTRDALCQYVNEHTLSGSGLNLAQYVSLALYLGPAPGLVPTADETELPPDSTQVVNVLPLVRSFAEEVHLQSIWAEHRPEYEAQVQRLHDPLADMILNTNIYLRQPAAAYDGRRFLVLVEPMISPAAVNARIYGGDYVIVASPSTAPDGLHLPEIRHTYLHFMVEPMVYTRSTAVARLTPLLKTVQNAPLDFTYKSDAVALVAECLIKAIEARTLDTGLTRPRRPETVRQRADLESYTAANAVYEREAEAARSRLVDLDMRQGWVLTRYFYGQLAQIERDGTSLKDNVGEMIYGMDVDHERRVLAGINFLPEGTHDVVRRSAPAPHGLQLAEMKLLQGDSAGASSMAEKALADPAGDHAEANYILARIDVMQRQPQQAVSHFQAALATAHDPHTLAWSHIYLGRLYDVAADRKKAVGEYKAALATPALPPDGRAAAETGLQKPFSLPLRDVQGAAATAPAEDDQPLDPTGRAEKESYKPVPVTLPPMPPAAGPAQPAESQPPKTPPQR